MKGLPFDALHFPLLAFPTSPLDQHTPAFSRANPLISSTALPGGFAFCIWVSVFSSFDLMSPARPTIVVFYINHEVEVRE